jgi:5,10-methenyltetrahydrofolate synthetase
MRPARPPDARRALRRRLIAARLALSEAACAEAGSAVLAWLESRFPPGSLGLVGGYWPIRGETDCRPYLLRTIEAGGGAALPVVTGPQAPLVFRPWTLETPMEAGRWDTLHPAAGPGVSPAALLIPLVAFDVAGHRLGYGGGFYDRTLAALEPRPLAIGVGFEAGRLASIDPGPHDHPMDVIVTEAGVFETQL